MNILTIDGYKNILDCPIGTLLKAYEVGTGNVIWNKLLKVDGWTEERVDTLNESLDDDNKLVRKWYLINGIYKVFAYQSIWTTPTTVKHVFQLEVGDVIYSDEDEDIIVTSFEETIPDDVWYRLVVSNDHSFIADGITLHNASRYWRGTTSTSFNNVNNWSSTSGGAVGSSIPTTTDDATWDGGGNNPCVVNINRTVISITVTTGFTSSMSINNSITLLATAAITLSNTMSALTGLGTIGINVNGSASLTTNGKSIDCTFRNSVGTLTVNDDVTFNGSYTNSGFNGYTTNGNNFYFYGAVNCNGVGAVGTTNFYLKNGSSIGGTVRFGNPIYIDGNATLNSTLKLGGGTLTYVSGTPTISTVTINASQTLDLSGTTIPTLILSHVTALNFTVTLNSDFNISSNFTNTSSTAANSFSFVSNVGGIQRKLTLQQGATMDLGFTNFTDINAGDGLTIWVWKPTLSNTNNIRSLEAPRNVSNTFLG